MSWEKVKLNNVIHKPISGEWGEEGNEVFVLRTTNFTNDGRIDLNDVVKRSVPRTKIEAKKLRKGDTILEKSGGSPSQPVGRVVYFDLNGGAEYLCNNFTSVIRPKENIDPKYLFWFLFNNHVSKKTLRYQNKTTGIINLQTDRYLNELDIPLPPLPTQQKIAAILDAADNLRRKDNELLTKYESLLQSIFYHLFGNPLKNEKGWDVALLSNVVDTRLGKMLDAKKINGKHLYKYLGNSNVLWNEFDLNDLKEMDFSSEERQVFNLRRGDILMCEGGEVGRCAIWETDDADIYFQKALHRIRVKKEKLNEHFFVWLMFIMSKNNGFKDYVSSATIAHLTGAKLRTMKLVLPPIKLQNHFASIAHNIQLQKKQVIDQASQSEALFKKLLQKAFKGELMS